MPRDIEPRLLRAFAAVADDLHFTRAAARLYVAQQALSRDIRRLERELGVDLFVRTTRQVVLTADGERLLPYALRVLAAQDGLLAASAAEAPALLVDLNTEGMVGGRVLARARELAPGRELMARFASGLTGASAEIAAGRLDASFGYFEGLDPALRAGLSRQLVRYEPLAVLLPSGHRLAERQALTLGDLAGEVVYAGDGNPLTREWTDLARQLFAGHAIEIAPPAPMAVGRTEFQRVMTRNRSLVLAVVDFPEMPDTVLRPLVAPVPLAPLSLVWRKGRKDPGIESIRAAAKELTDQERWLERIPDSWIPSLSPH